MLYTSKESGPLKKQLAQNISDAIIIIMDNFDEISRNLNHERETENYCLYFGLGFALQISAQLS